jgi:hypothetical protein
VARDSKTKRVADQLGRDITEGLDDHGSLAGLADDDHAQYLNTARHDLPARHELSGDGTRGRILRESELTLADGTGADTLKCTLASVWNGDAIAETDNVAKGATTGNFTLSADGTTLTVEAAGLSGNCVMSFPAKSFNSAGPFLDCDVRAATNDIQVILRNPTSGAGQDLCGHVDNGTVKILILYITSA